VKRRDGGKEEEDQTEGGKNKRNMVKKTRKIYYFLCRLHTFVFTKTDFLINTRVSQMKTVKLR
jgi:hypothetical protein